MKRALALILSLAACDLVDLAEPVSDTLTAAVCDPQDHADCFAVDAPVPGTHCAGTACDMLCGTYRSLAVLFDERVECLRAVDCYDAAENQLCRRDCAIAQAECLEAAQDCGTCEDELDCLEGC